MGGHFYFLFSEVVFVHCFSFGQCFVAAFFSGPHLIGDFFSGCIV